MKDIQLSFNCDDVKELAVKISYIANKENARESSGVIVRPKNETDYFFVLTAKHSFKENDEQAFNDVNVEKLKLTNITVIHEENKNLRPFKIIDTEFDLVVLVIKNSFCVENNLATTKILDGQFIECGLFGYPNIAEGDLDCLKCTYLMSQNNNEYQIESNKTLHSSYKDEVETTKGFSGSGVFTQVNDKYLLAGIISEVVPHRGSFKCINLSYVLSKISLEKYGGIETISLESPSTKVHIKLHQSQNHLDIEQLKMIIGEDVTKELERFKEESLNGIEKRMREWISEIKKSQKWKSVDDTIKSEILYEEVKLLISDNKLEDAHLTIKEIRILNPSRYTNRLMSWIEIQNGNLPKAVALLDNNETSTLNQKAAIYIEMRDYNKAKSAIGSIAIEDRDYETYRIKAIYELYKNEENLLQALKEINKSLELNTHYLESMRVKAIILFYQATLFTVVSSLVPPIAQKNMLKIDAKSQEKIQLSKKLLSEVIEKCSEYRDKTWIVTILMLLDIDEAIKYIKQIYKDETYKIIALQFIVMHNLDIDIEKDIKAIESVKPSDLHIIDTIIKYYYIKQNKEKLFDLLKKYKDVYTKYNQLDNWNEVYFNALLKFELYSDAHDFIDKNQLIEKDEAKANIYMLTNDYKSACAIYEKLFKETSNPNYRLIICEIKASENDWEYITKYTDYLIENFQTEKVVELVVYAERNCNNCNKAKELIEFWSTKIKNSYIINNFHKIKAYCEDKAGFPYKAISIFEKHDLIKTNQDILSLAQLYKKTGSDEKIESLIIKHKDNQDIDINTKIQIASMTKNSPVILKSIIRHNDIDNIDKSLALTLLMADIQFDESIFNAVFGKKVSQDLQDLSNDENSQIWMMNTNDIIPFIAEQKRQSAYMYNLYRQSKVPVHLAEYILVQNMHIYIRSAKKFHFTNIENIKDTILYLDVTSVILLFQLKKLEKVLNTFSKVFLPANIFYILEDLQVKEDLVNIIKINFELGKLFYCEELKNPKAIDKENPSNTLLSLLNILEIEEDAIVCVDDRLTNNFQTTTNRQTIIGINDILFSFYKQKIINEDDYYLTLLEMRKKDYLYILITSKEIIYHLKRCDIRNDELKESDNLKILKKSLSFMVKNFKYLKSFTQEEMQSSRYAEPFFVTNQEREIHDSIIQLFNEKFEYNDDRYIYLNWILKNIFSVNMSYLTIKKLPHNIDITKTMSAISISSLFVQAIRITSISSQKSYFDWVYHNYFDIFFSINQDIFEGSINFIQNFITHDLIKENSSKEEKFIVGNLITNFPPRIKERIVGNNKILDSLMLHKIISIRNLKFDDNDFTASIKQVINGGRQKTIKTVDEKNEIILLKAKTIKGEEEIEFIHDGKIEYMDDVFKILSTSPLKRIKLCENNPKWFNMSDKNKEVSIEKLNSIKIHQDRLEELYKVIDNSYFYKNIGDKLKSKKLDFQDLCPENINTLLNHFRLDQDLSFDKALDLSIETLLSEKQITEVIDTVHHFPVLFPSKIIDILSKKNNQEQMQLIKQFLKTSNSPISIIQMMRVLLEVDAERFSFIIRYLLKQLFSKKFKLEIRAFFELLNYIKQEFNRRYRDLNNEIKLILIWAHTNKLMKFFNAYNVSSEWMIKEFKQRSSIPTIEIFKTDYDYSKDVLNDTFNYERFLVSSVCYIYNNDFSKAQGTFAKNKIEKLVDGYNNSLDFICLNVSMPNATGTFLQVEDMSILSSFPTLEKSLNAIDDFVLNSWEHSIIPLNLMSLKYNTNKLNNIIEDKLVEYIKNYRSNNSRFIDIKFSKSKDIYFQNYYIKKFNIQKWNKNINSTHMILLDLLFMIKQLKNIEDKNVSKKVEKSLIDISNDIRTENEAGALFEALIYLSTYRKDDLKSRVKLFVKYIHICKKLQEFDAISRIINVLLTHLPMEYANCFLLEKFENMYENTI